MKTRLLLKRVASYSQTAYICKRCRLSLPSHSLLSTRAFSTSPTRPSSNNPPLPPPEAYARLPSRALLSISGPDATTYLQGAITAHISTSTRISGFYAAFLNAQGRVLNDVFIYPWKETSGKFKDEEAWLIEVDSREAERLAKQILRYRLRAKYDVRVLNGEELRIWSVWDKLHTDQAVEGWTKHVSALGERDGEISCIDTRAPAMGRRFIIPGGMKPEVDMEESTEAVYKVRRYLNGVPEGQDELIREVALPQESNIDFMHGIDYRKGCYVGQELTIRTHHTGVVRKRILPVVVYGKDEPEPTALEYVPEKEYGVEQIPRETSIGRVEKKGRSAGKWLSGVGNVGLGLCRLETMTSVLVQGEAGGYKEGDEFKIEWGEGNGQEMVKVKAFVPSWHSNKLNKMHV